MLIAATIPTSEAVFAGVCFVVMLVYGAIVEIRRDNNIKELDEYHKEVSEKLDGYIEELDDAINTVRAGKNTKSKPTNS